MKYNYRWLYVAVLVMLVVACGCQYALYPSWLELSRLRVARDEASAEVHQLAQLAKQEKNNAAQQEKPVDQRDFLSNMVELVNLNGLTLQSIRFAIPQEVSLAGIDMAHLAVKGGFAEMASFVYAMANQPMPVLVTDFSYKMIAEDQLIALMDILALKITQKKTAVYGDDTVFADLQSPFCGASHTGTVNQDAQPDKPQSAFLKQIKMIGYLHQGARSSALLRLPNNAIIEARLGSVIGKESGTVAAIHPDQVEVLLPDHTSYLLR